MIKPYLINSDSTIQRKQYVAPEALVEAFVEEGEMLAGTPVTGEKDDMGGNSQGGDNGPMFPPVSAKENDLFFDNGDLEW